MDAVTLHTGHLDGLAAFYRDALELSDVSDGYVSGTTSPGRVVLGREGRPLVILVSTPGLPSAAPGQAGLFHTAMHFPDRPSLAAALVSAARHPLSRFVGSADHLVSLAFYFTDPDGNGIELYWDRPPGQWTWTAGRVGMDSLPLHPGDFVQEYATERGGGDARVGHVHLKVGDIAQARQFYVDTVGFEVTAEWDGALFVSAGGYHHHMGMNTWQSRGAGPRAATIGLGQVAIAVPTRDDLAALTGRLAGHRIPVRDDGRSVRFQDPWGSLLEVSAAD